MEQCSGLFFSGTPDLLSRARNQIKREWLAVLNPKCELIGRISSGPSQKAADFAMPFALQVFEPEGFVQTWRVYHRLMASLMGNMRIKHWIIFRQAQCFLATAMSNADAHRSLR